MITSYELPLIGRKEVATGTVELTLDRTGGQFDFEPGQHVELSLEGASHTFSIASSPSDKDILAVAFRVSKSPFKEAIMRALLGTRVAVRGPFGVFTIAKDNARPLVFVAGGIGITPLLSMLRSAAERAFPVPITLIYANRDGAGAAYLGELKALAGSNARFTLATVFGPLDKAPLAAVAAKQDRALWYIAGPSEMVAAAGVLLAECGVKEGDVRVEAFSGYRSAGAPSASSGQAEQKTTQSRPAGSAEGAKEGALLASLNKLALVSETDLAGTITYANDMFVEISKYSREELIGQNHRILKSGYHPQSFYDDMWHKYLLQGKIWKGEIKNKTKDGSFYWVESAIGPLFDEQGVMNGYIATRFLITKRKEAEEKLESYLERTKTENKSLEDTKSAMLNLLEDGRALEDSLQRERTRLATIVSTMGEGLVVVDANNTVTLMNEAAERMLEVPLQKVSGKESKIAFPLLLKDGKKVPDEERPTAQAISAGTTVMGLLSDNFQYQLPSGRKIYIALIVTPLKRNDGSVYGAVVVFRDITEERKLDQTRETFISIASHQLRTPLTSIRWYTEMLDAGDAGPLTDPQKGFLSNIYTGVLRLSETLNMLLSLTRVESGRVKTDPVDIDLVALTNDVVRELAPYSDAKNMTIDVKLDNTPSANVKMDVSMVRQVIMNLLSNAIRYTENKTAVRVRIEQKTDHWQYSVADRGIGIAQENKSRIFEKFFRADNAVALVPDGNGLGLALVKDLVELWGGRVWFESELGKETVFYFTIPFATPPPPLGRETSKWWKVG